MMKDKSIEVNLPFQRVPVCDCDKGMGDPPTKQDMLECKMRGGRCREDDKPDEPDHV